MSLIPDCETKMSRSWARARSACGVLLAADTLNRQDVSVLEKWDIMQQGRTKIGVFFRTRVNLSPLQFVIEDFDHETDATLPDTVADAALSAKEA